MKANIKPQRINWIDQAKGIGILLVVIGHMNIPQELSKIIFSFHMPLFFFISGYLYNEKKYSVNFENVFYSKLKSLVWPFITFTIFYLILSVFINQNSIINSFDYVNFFKGNRSLNTPLWFLTALFSTEIIFSQIIRFFNIRKAIFLILLILIIGFFNAIFWRYSFFLNIDIALVTILFFLVGWLFKKYNWGKSIFKKGRTLLYIIIAAIILLLTSLTNEKINILENIYGNLILMLLAVIFGISLTILLAKQILNFKFLRIVFEYFGKNSLIILGVHIILAPFVVSIFGQMPFRLDRVLSLGLIFVSIELINRYFPIILQLKGFKKNK
tara:strand:- start:10417 stop:11400 length:984 start_codon:yes stop_codon:yes gene_type:complete